MDKKYVESLRDFIGKVNRIFSQQEKSQFYQAAPFKTEQPEVSDPPAQITGVRGKRTDSIPGDKASGNRINGGTEAGGRTASY